MLVSVASIEDHGCFHFKELSPASKRNFEYDQSVENCAMKMLN